MGRKALYLCAGILLFGAASPSVASAQTWAYLSQWGSPGSGDGQFYGPDAIVVGAGGNIYVADYSNHRIQLFTSNGAFVGQWGGEFPSISGPRALAVDANGNVYAANASRIDVFTGTGVPVTGWALGGSNGEAAGVAVDANGKVYATDRASNFVQVFTSSGAYLYQWGGTGSGDGQFGEPGGVAVDAGGNIYVADQDNNRIQKFTGNGTYLTQWGGLGSGMGLMRGPRGVAVDASGTVYVEPVQNSV
jgi:DNA-binding beta-propeller fold protein YncE